MSDPSVNHAIMAPRHDTFDIIPEENEEVSDDDTDDSTDVLREIEHASVHLASRVEEVIDAMADDSRRASFQDMDKDSLAGDTDGAPLELTLFHGAEALRQIVKTARKLSGAARLVESFSISGFNPMEEIPGESKDDIKQLDGKLAAVDVKQFFRKIIGEKISIKVPMKTLAEFDQLSVEETLSETRIDQSIALPLHTTNMFRPEEAPIKPFLNNSVQSPPTSDTSAADIKISPARIQRKAGGECLLRLTNLSHTRVHWDMSWPSSKLSINPGSGEREAVIKVALSLISCVQESSRRGLRPWCVSRLRREVRAGEVRCRCTLTTASPVST